MLLNLSFETLIGNEQIKETLNNIIQNNNLTHSYMFVGPSGIGKTLFAKEFAKMILCQTNGTKPCGKCKSCIELENNNNPDLIIIEPDNTTIKIEQIRQMQLKILEKPIISNKKVYIIKDADLMTRDASNCLLKTLEEPPSFITIIMTGTNESLFLNTIKSRCVKIAFSKIQDNLLKKFFEDNHGFTMNEALLKACEGSIEKALKVNEKKQDYEEAAKIFLNIENYKLLDVINKLDFLYKNKENIYEILDYINIILSSKAINNLKYIRYIEAVEQTKKSLKQNSNYDMSIDNMLYKIWEE